MSGRLLGALLLLAVWLLAQSPEAQLARAVQLHQSGDLEGAIRAYETVLRAQPDNERAAILLADCELRAGDNRKVIALLSPLESSHQDDRALAYLLGTALIRDNEPEKGQKLIDRILRNGESAEAHVMLGSARMMGLDYKNAVQEFARAIELNPKLPLAHRLYGRALLLESNVPQALEAFRAELAVNPNDYDS